MRVIVSQNLSLFLANLLEGVTAQVAMREHLLCPSTEGCHVLARPWSEPLADFAVEEFLALHGLFTRDARDGGKSTTTRRRPWETRKRRRPRARACATRRVRLP